MVGDEMMIQNQRGNNPRRWDKKGVVVASRDDRDDAPVPAQVVQEPVVGDIPDAEGVQQDDVAVGQPADGIVINGPEPAGVQVQPEVGPVRRSTRATKGITSRYKDFVLGEEAQD